MNGTTRLDEFDNYLDDNVSAIYLAQPLAQDWARIAKIIEELGEAIQAFIGMTGQNPRKGISDTEEHMLEELADTALTAMYAIQHFTKDKTRTRFILDARHALHLDRIGL